MRGNTEDKTIERNYVQKWRFLIEQYELTKTKKHPNFRFVSDFYKFHKTNRQTFLKYYNRYKLNPIDGSFLPQKRGPKWKSRRPDIHIEQEVIDQRLKGNNRYEIHAILKPKLKDKAPSPSGIYNILRRENLNRLKPKMKANKRKIIKERAGELGHIDCHYLSKDLIVNSTKRYYLVCIIDSYSRIAWAEVTEDVKSLTVMFSVLKSINLLHAEYKIQFEEVLTDNGSEFCGKENKMHHPFERMLIELGIKHRCTRPYRPQTNGKVERFWRSLNEDLIEDTTFDSIEHFKDELMQYLIYYNNLRCHQALKGLAPKVFLEASQENLSAN
jgi:transposase InsO family protein